MTLGRIKFAITLFIYRKNILVLEHKTQVPLLPTLNSKYSKPLCLVVLPYEEAYDCYQTQNDDHPSIGFSMV